MLSFFVPFANVVIPWMAVQELWKASQPGAHPALWPTLPSSPLVSWWWTARIAGSLLGYGANQMVPESGDLPDPAGEQLAGGAESHERGGLSMNGIQGPQLNPQLLQAALLVQAVSLDAQALLPSVRQDGSTLVSESRIGQWRTALQSALRLVRQLPVPAIFPPPAFATLAGAAGDQLDLALVALSAVPQAAPVTFPPQFGQVILSRETLSTLLSALQQAQALLVRALTA